MQMRPCRQTLEISAQESQNAWSQGERRRVEAETVDDAGVVANASQQSEAATGTRSCFFHFEDMVLSFLVNEA
jgi:hypothetical protein